MMPNESDEVVNEVMKDVIMRYNESEERQKSIDEVNREKAILPLILQNMKEAYETAKGSKRKKTSKELLIQYTSFLIHVGFTKRQIEEMAGITLDNNIYTECGVHARNNPGGLYIPIHKNKKINNRASKEEKVWKLINYILSVSVRTAEKRKVQVDKKQERLVPVLLRPMSIHDLLLGFKGCHPESTFKNQEMTQVVKICAPSMLKTLSALDTNGETNGRVNFGTKRKLIAAYLLHNDSRKVEELANKALNLIDQNEKFLKDRNGFGHAHHFGGNAHDGPACHCHFYAFNRKDPHPPPVADGLCQIIPEAPCGHRHSGSCAECEGVLELIDVIAELDYEVKFGQQGAPTAEKPWPRGIGERVHIIKDLETISIQMQICLHKYLHYIGHRARLTHESKYHANMDAKLKLQENRNVFFVEIDWAQKYLDQRYREKQGDYYGKAGIAWFGAKVQWYDFDQNKMQWYSVHAISENSTEDAHLSIQALSAVIAYHKNKFPRHKQFHLKTDGALCFSGIEFIARLAYFGKALGAQCLSHSIGEGGGNKSDIDAGFGSTKGLVDAAVIKGQGDSDIIDAYSLSRVLKDISNGGEKFIAMLLQPIRHCLNTPEKDDVDSVKYSAMRYFEYDRNKKPLKIRLYDQSFLDRGNHLSIVADGEILMSTLWGETHKVEDIVPLATDSNTQQIRPTPKRKIENTEKFEKVQQASVKKQKRWDLQMEKEETQQAARQARYGLGETLHECTQKGCIRVFVSAKDRDTHYEANGRPGQWCQTNGSPFSSMGKMRQLPTEHVNESLVDMATKMVKQICDGAHTDIQGMSEATVTRREDIEGTFSPGFGKTKAPKARKVAPEIKTAVAQMYAWGNMKGNHKLHPAQMHRLLLETGRKHMIHTYPSVDIFREKANDDERRIYNWWDIPDLDKLKLMVSGIGSKIKKGNQVMNEPVIEITERGRIFKQLLSKSSMAFLSDSQKVEDVVHELLMRGIGTHEYPTSTLIQKDVKGLPVCKEEKWTREQKQEIVKKLKCDIGKVTVPANVTFTYIEPLEIDADSEEDSDSDDDTEPREKLPRRTGQTKLKNSCRDSAKKICEPLEIHKVKLLSEYIGWTVEDEYEEMVEVEGRKNRKKTVVHSVYEINDVVKFTSDDNPERMYFQYNKVGEEVRTVQDNEWTYCNLFYVKDLERKVLAIEEEYI